MRMPIRPSSRSGQTRINFKRNQRAAFWQNYPAMPSGDILTVWTGNRWDWSTPYQTRVTAWLRGNGIDPTCVLADRPIHQTARHITWWQPEHTDGRPSIASRLCSAPLLVPFTNPTEA